MLEGVILFYYVILFHYFSLNTTGSIVALSNPKRRIPTYNMAATFLCYMGPVQTDFCIGYLTKLYDTEQCCI